MSAIRRATRAFNGDFTPAPARILENAQFVVWWWCLLRQFQTKAHLFFGLTYL